MVITSVSQRYHNNMKSTYSTIFHRRAAGGTTNTRNVPRDATHDVSHEVPRDVPATPCATSRATFHATSHATLSGSSRDPRDVPRASHGPRTSARQQEQQQGRSSSRSKRSRKTNKVLGPPSDTGILSHSFARTHDTYTKTEPRSLSRLGSHALSPS